MVDHEQEYELCSRAAERLAADGFGGAVAAVQTGSGIRPPELRDRRTIQWSELAGVPGSTAPGHRGLLHHGFAGDAPVLVLEGRLHAYEGHGLHEVVRPIRTVGLLGVPHLVLTNASGGVREGWGAGTLVRIVDHLDLRGCDPLAGRHDPRFGDRFVVTAGRAHDRGLGELAEELATELGVKLETGVYCGVRGPCFETPAEVRAMRVLGVDVCGMSTVPEVLAATQLGLRTVVFSLVANPAGEVADGMTAEEEVLQVASARSGDLTRLIEALVQRLVPPQSAADENAGGQDS